MEIYTAYTFTVTKAAQPQPRGRCPTLNGQQEHPVPCPQEGPKKWMNRLTQSFNIHTGELPPLWLPPIAWYGLTSATIRTSQWLSQNKGLGFKKTEKP